MTQVSMFDGPTKVAEVTDNGALRIELHEDQLNMLADKVAERLGGIDKDALEIVLEAADEFYGDWDARWYVGEAIAKLRGVK